MVIGVDYYPEHWPQTRWETDATLMAKAGFNVVRLSEFAWINLEPVEGRFEFDWLDEILEVLGRHGISAILSTPTAVMPAWAARKYPETLAMQKDGVRLTWGVRKNNCFSSGAYRMLSERITRAMSDHYSASPHVIGWQTDNEFGGPVCYCDICRGEFQDWLREQYGSLDELNRAWGLHFWGHVLSAWGEVQIPKDDASFNPGQCLDWRRFNSWLNVRFQADQVRILRERCPSHFVTHNFMGLFKELNYYHLAADLDFVSWDNYPVWGVPEVRYDASLAADVMRGLKGKNFWIMEQTAGPCGWGSMGRNPHPGELRSVAYQQLAHGADGNIWFRWRTCTAGREQYWHGLLGHDGRPLRRYNEAAQVAQEYHRLSAELEGTSPRPEVALLYDYESIWAFDIQPAYGSLPFTGQPGRVNGAQEAYRRYYQALFRAGVNVDVISPAADLSPYKLVIAPHLYILPDTVADKMNTYVHQGGVLLTDFRTAVKDATGLAYDRTLPGKLSEMLGITIEEYETIPDQYPVTGTGRLEGAFTAVSFADWTRSTGAEVLATFDPWHVKPYAAVTRQGYGLGKGWYVSALFKEPAFYDRLIQALLADAGVRPLVHPPEGVEVSVRQTVASGEAGRRALIFLINHTETPQTVQVPAGLDLLNNQPVSGALALERHGVAVVRVDL